MDRRVVFGTAAWACLAAVLMAQTTQCVDRSGNPNADCARKGGGRCPTCQRCCPSCDQPQPSKPETASHPESADQHGMFVAPPRSGTVMEEAGSVGVRGLALHFPEMRIGLPTLEFPSLIRYRSGARMKIDSAVAPFVPVPSAALGTGGRTESNELPEPESVDTPQAESAEDTLTQKCRELARMKAELSEAQQELQSKVDELHRCLRQLESGQPRPLPQPMPSEDLPAPCVEPAVRPSSYIAPDPPRVSRWSASAPILRRLPPVEPHR